MSSKNKSESTAEFMLAEYQDLYQNVMHLENKLFNHLSFFTTLFVGIVTASIAIVQLVGDTGSLALPFTVALLSCLFVLFVIVGRFELRMTTELRVRKMKFIEAITQIREYFADRDEVIRDYLILPVGVKKAPPYLRVRCKDWYQILYISLMNGIAAFTAWILPLWFIARWLRQIVGGGLGLLLIVFLVISWLILGLLIFYVVFWQLSYKSVMEFCKRYDGMRAERLGEETRYDLLDPPLPESRLRWTFGDWIAWWTEYR